MNNVLQLRIQADLADLRAGMTEAEKLLVTYSSAVTKASTIAANASARAQAAEQAAEASLAKATQAKIAAEAAKVRASETTRQALLAQAAAERNQSQASILAADKAAKAAETAAKISVRANQAAIKAINDAANAETKAANMRKAASESLTRAQQAEIRAIEIARKKEAAEATKAAKAAETAIKRREAAEKVAANAMKREATALEVAKRKEAAAAVRAARDAERAAKQRAAAENRANELAQRQIGGSTAVFQEFNRVIQDAPFGIIGVGNNLQQLASNFGALTASQKGVGPALKASFATLTSGINPAILAVTALTTAWTLYEMGVFDAKDETKSFKEELDKFRESLDGVADATLTGASNAEKEAQSLNLLRMQAESPNVPMEERLEAVDELQKKYPDFLGNLTKEQVLTGEVGDAYEKLAERIVATAKARAYSDKIGENSAKVFSIEERALQRANDILEKRAELEKAKALSQASAAKVSGQFTAEDQTVLNLQKELNDLINDQIADVQAVTDLNTENVTLTGKITEQIKDGAVFTDDLASKTDKLKDKMLTLEEVISKVFKEKDPITQFELIDDAVSSKAITPEKAAELKAFIAKALEEADNAFITESLRKSIQESWDAAIEKVKVKLNTNPDDPYGISAALTKMGPPVDEKAEPYDPTEDLRRVRQEAAMTEAAFDGLGRAVGLAFGSGNEWGRFLSSFIRFAGEVIAQNMAMAKANMITIGTQTGMATGPAAAFATPGIISAGLALIGSLFAAIKSGSSGSTGGGSSPVSKNYGLPKREKGGPVSAGKAYIVGEKRPEIFVPNTSGMIIPRIDDFASNIMPGSTKKGPMTIKVEVFGIIEGENTRITNKRSEQRVNKT